MPPAVSERRIAVVEKARRRAPQQPVEAFVDDFEDAFLCPCAALRRKPGPLIAFSGLRPGDKGLDLIPGDGDWTRVLSKIVGPEGRVYAVWPPLPRRAPRKP